MRVNLFVAQATGMSRRAADNLLRQGSITINGQLAKLGDQVQSSDVVTLNSQRLSLPEKSQTILLNKPVGYVCSRDGQGSKTIYDLLPAKFQRLKPVGRLDKDSSGLLLLTSD
ncbi:MAG: pseudouridine synthase, partial [Candidatus Saccharimonadales bacterium]